MAPRLQHYGWDCSPYSAKTRAWLRYSGIPFDDVHPDGFRLFGRIRKAVGRPIMPTVQWPDGRWEQDSSAIIDALQGESRRPSVHPEGPRQRLTSYLLELHADEWLPTVHMHTRWNRPINAAFALDEFAREALPWVPRFLGRLIVGPMRDRLAGYRPILGIRPDTLAGIEAFTQSLLDQLDTHLAELRFLLGDRPCLADFALYGPLWAHLYRDPDTTRLFDSRPALVAWMERVAHIEGDVGDFLPDDAVPASLEPVLRTLLGEQMAFRHKLVAAIDAWCEQHPDAARVPRSLGDGPFTIGGAAGQRRLLTATQWKLQRVTDAHAGLPEAERRNANAWLEGLGGSLPTIAHPLTRRSFALVLA